MGKKQRKAARSEAAFYCEVCRQTSFRGWGHVYGLKHQERLGVLLGRFLRKVEDAQQSLKAVQVEKYDIVEHEQNFWCYCCKREVKKHITDGSLAVLYGGLLEHFVSSEHMKQTNKFWWENKADIKLKDKFILSNDAYEKFKTAVAKAVENYEEKEDEYVKQEAEYIREVERKRREVVQAAFEPQAEQNSIDGLPVFAIDHYESHGTYIAEENEPGPSGVNFPYRSCEVTNGQNLTFIGDQISKPEIQNIHTGATPPWLIDDDDDLDTTPKSIGPSYEEFIQHKEKEKLKKLPPNRVGANFNHTSETDDSWLPSFGRVWNDGRRWQSRHQFRLEEGKKRKRDKR
ncbi:coiled-coil domain-containing protein 84 isoform X2 [Stegostoma tigrinum]|uniref:coiled-coil domain-containing protein 84 isoform X2 n=1 Tax=Stegostoma tigrinum TaxID=3053191 RepID=UPI00202ADB49|nr:coiled-coil domain-containing protein 84 isoform X2 [Stegostoma tigrinum]